MSKVTGESSNNRPPWQVQDYIRALRQLERQQSVEPEALHLLALQIQAPRGRINATELAEQAGLSVERINRLYGRLGKTLGNILTGESPEQMVRGWPFLSHGDYEQGRFFWTLHPALARAIQALEWCGEDQQPQFLAALQELGRTRKLTAPRRQMLQLHYEAPDHDLTAGELGLQMGWTFSGEMGAMSSANLHYGGLGRLFAPFLGPCPVTYDGTDKPMTVAYLVTFWHDGRNWHWIMRRGLRQALEHLKLVQAVPQLKNLEALPNNDIDEVLPEVRYREGAVRTVQVNAYERDRAARRACLEHHGVLCQVCRVDLTHVYGQMAAGFIHVHHVRPLSEIGEEYEVDPRTDLLPVCPNCHAMLHLFRPPLSVAELQTRMQQTQEAQRERDSNTPEPPLMN